MLQYVVWGRALHASFGLAICIILAGGMSAMAAERASHADTARFMAGMSVSEGSKLAGLTKARSWQAHARSLDNGWEKLDKRQISKIRNWSKSELNPRGKTLFYMFSGPDYLYANAFFPDADTYVLAGLEPVGREPDLLNISAGARAVGLSKLRTSMNSVLHLSFFITKKMKSQLRGAGFPGTIPVLYVFLARAGKNVEGLEYLKLGEDGMPVTLDASNPKGAIGVKILFSDGQGGGQKSLYYFATNIADYGLKKTGFLNFLSSLGQGDAFVKSCSYLLHKGHFGQIRDFLLNNSQTFVQDDSGVPLKYFKRDVWDLKPYGRYTGPISIFANHYQRDMRRLFSSKKQKNINFGIGYKWRVGTSSVLVAEKIKAPAEPVSDNSGAKGEATQTNAETDAPAKEPAAE